LALEGDYHQRRVGSAKSNNPINMPSAIPMTIFSGSGRSFTIEIRLSIMVLAADFFE
jgi:hypothetical protein